MLSLAMRFRGILRGVDVQKLDQWLDDADRSGLYGIRRFARTLRQDLAAVRNAISAIIVTAGAAVPGPLAVQRAPPPGPSAGSS